MSDDRRMQAVAQRIQALVDSFAASPDTQLKERAQELVTRLMELYGSGLARICGVLEREDGRAGPITGALLDDELVSSLLVLHELHPEDVETRIARGLERVRSVAHADITLRGVAGSTVQVHVRRAADAPAGRAPELQQLIQEVVAAAAPDVATVEIEGLEPEAPGLVQLEYRRATRRHGDRDR